jgi:hypothetical protein
MDISGLGNELGHNHTQAYRDFNEASAQSETAYAASQAASNGSSMRSVAKKAGYGLVAGAVIGMVLLRVPAYSKMMTKGKSWQAAAIGAAVAVPLASMYA